MIDDEERHKENIILFKRCHITIIIVIIRIKITQNRFAPQ